jgi:hypothetical protein
MLMLATGFLAITGHAQEVPANVQAAIKMAETIVEETGLEPGQQWSRYNDWMYQNHMICEGIVSMGEALDRDDFKSYYKRNMLFFCNNIREQARQEIEAKEDKDARLGPKERYLTPRWTWQCGMIAGFAETVKSSPHPEKESGIKIFDDLTNRVPVLPDGSLGRHLWRWKSNCLQIDDAYMVIPYWARKAKTFGEPEHLERAIKETLSYHKHLWNEEDRLMHCMWVAKTGKNDAHYWGRGNGWFVMAITDVMAFSPDTHPQYETVLDVYNRVMAGLMTRQGKDGLWHQVLDHPESYTETSCSGMFTFSLLRGFNKGWLPPEAREAGLNGWAGLQTKLTEDNQLKDVCPATGMNPSLKHYLERPRVTHDLHGIGPYLLSAGEVLKLKN